MSAPSIPEGLDVIQEGDHAIIRRRWFSHVVWFLLFFCVAWDSFLVFWYGMALGPHKPGDGFSLMVVIFPIAHVAVGIGLSYFVLCTFFNRTDLVLADSSLRVRTYPLPWVGNKTVAAADLAGFLVRERGQRNSDSAVSYAVVYVDRQNKERPLVKMLTNEDQAAYLANALTRFYILKDGAG